MLACYCVHSIIKCTAPGEFRSMRFSSRLRKWSRDLHYIMHRPICARYIQSSRPILPHWRQTLLGVALHSNIMSRTPLAIPKTVVDYLIGKLDIHSVKLLGWTETSCPLIPWVLPSYVFPNVFLGKTLLLMIESVLLYILLPKLIIYLLAWRQKFKYNESLRN